MLSKLEYDSYVERLNPAMVAALALAAVVLLFTPSVAQINGTPASVNSIGFGGKTNPTPGVPASVTSLGPRGLQPRGQFSTMAPANPNPSHGQHHHRNHQNTFFPAGGVYYVPYPVESDTADAAVETAPADDYRGGPTIFDRRGPGTPARSYLDDYPPNAARSRSDAGRQAETESAAVTPPAEVPVPDQPQTVLVFKDGHQLEIQNYALVGGMLYDFTPGRSRKIALADLDLKATAKQNDDLGISFQLPPAPETNK